jgi:23S rRNA (uracil1939-C5)-methyltransferase
LIDIHECHVLTPGLFQLGQRLRDLFSKLLHVGNAAELYTVETENGFDLAISWKRRTTPQSTEQIARMAPKLNLVRVTNGAELVYESAAPVVTFGQALIELPPGAFLQPTREGEQILQARAIEAVGNAKRIADLFSGCGTFSLPLAARAHLHCVDADAQMLSALAGAARRTPGTKPVSTEIRDLFKHPLTPAELVGFDAVVLDPPRAGASAQATKLSQSPVRRIAYISCNAASFARDARVLIDGGFRLDWIVGVDQFLWSAHIELAAAFSRN